MHVVLQQSSLHVQGVGEKNEMWSSAGHAMIIVGPIFGERGHHNYQNMVHHTQIRPGHVYIALYCCCIHVLDNQASILRLAAEIAIMRASEIKQCSHNGHVHMCSEPNQISMRTDMAAALCACTSVILCIFYLLNLTQQRVTTRTTPALPTCHAFPAIFAYGVRFASGNVIIRHWAASASFGYTGYQMKVSISIPWRYVNTHIIYGVWCLR